MKPLRSYVSNILKSWSTTSFPTLCIAQTVGRCDGLFLPMGYCHVRITLLLNFVLYCASLVFCVILCSLLNAFSDAGVAELQVGVSLAGWREISSELVSMVHAYNQTLKIIVWLCSCEFLESCGLLVFPLRGVTFIWLSVFSE